MPDADHVDSTLERIAPMTGRAGRVGAGDVVRVVENLTASLAEFGVPAATVTIPFNAFMCTSVGPDGG